MSVRLLSLVVVLLALFQGNANAEDKIDVGKYLVINGTDKFDASLWKLRISNYMMIARLKSTNDFMLWCAAELDKEQKGDRKPCEIFYQEAPDVESAVLAAIPFTKLMIETLEKAPNTKENTDHLSDLKDQLLQMQKLPTPAHGMIDKLKANKE